MKNTIKNLCRSNQFFNFSIFVGYDYYISLGHSVSQCSLVIPNFEYILVTKRTPKNLFLGKTPKIDQNCENTFSKKVEKKVLHIWLSTYIYSSKVLRVPNIFAPVCISETHSTTIEYINFKCIYITYIFSSNQIVLKISFSLCFWAQDCQCIVCIFLKKYYQ